jgi:Rrf2 family protein
MKLSTRGRYSTRLMLELGLSFGQGPMLLKDISSRQEISLKYLGQLIIPLKIAGLIKSTRGSHGGYYLARPPEDIKLSQILKAVEGNLAFTECVESPDICYRSGTCVAHDIWEQASRQFDDTLSSITLADMLKKHNTRSLG